MIILCITLNSYSFIYSNNCNCDAKVPSETSDVGIITNSTALPIIELKFGGLEYDAQSGFHTLGKLSCSGKKRPEEKPSSCSSLKKAGIFRSAYYDIKEEGQFSKLVYCNMSTQGYQNVGEEYIESSESHFVELDETIEEMDGIIDDINLRVEVSLILHILISVCIA